ncbi:MAG: polysaccharide biosynthesis tyrosine autokinase, partial [Gemmatimonadota bacterium]
SMAGNLISKGTPGDALEPRLEMVPQAGSDHGLTAIEPTEDGVHWGRYIAALRRYKWLMLLIVIIGSAGGVVATRFIPPKFQAKATIWIQSSGGKQGPIRSGELLNSTAWIELLRTGAVFDPVVIKMALFVVPDDAKDSLVFKGIGLSKGVLQTGDYTLTTDRAGEKWTLSREGVALESGAVGDSIGRNQGLLWAPPARVFGRDRKIKFTLLHPRQASSDLQEQLSTQMAEDGNFLRIGLAGSNPQRLAVSLNALVDQFVSLAADLKRAQATEMRVALDSQMVTAQKNLNDAESHLLVFRNQTITLPNEGTPVPSGLTSTTPTVTQNYFGLKVSLETLRSERKSIQDVLARGQAGGFSVDAFQTIPAVTKAPDLVGALNELTKYEADVRALLYRYTPEYKGVQDDNAKIETLKTQTIPRYALSLIDQLKHQEADLETQIGSSSKELENIPARTINEARLTREVAAAEDLFKTLQGRHEEAKLAEASAIPDVRKLDDAVAPDEPTSNSAPRIILMAVMASLGFAVGLALLLDQVDKRFRYPEQVTRELGLSILGAIPAINKTKNGELAAQEAAQVVEAFRTIRLNLAHSYGAAGPVLLTVSSPGAGDGKSLVSSNLAMSFAEAGYKTLIIDGDIRRGELHRMFGIDRRPGLLDYLTGASRKDEIIRATSHKGLSVIPCGTRRHQGPELLGSGAMGQLMAELKTQYNVIIIDSPPLGAGIDPFVLGTSTGHMMLVLRSGETDRQMAEAKLKLLDRLPIRVLGAVLNSIQAEGVYRYYSYVYGYTADEEPAALSGTVGEVNPET